MAPQKLESLLDLAEILGQQKDYQETLRLVAQQATVIFVAESATVMMLNPRTRQTMKTIFREHEKTVDETQHKIHLHVSGWIIKNKQSFASRNLPGDAHFAKHLFRELRHVAALGVPLWVEGVVIGVLVLVKSNSGDSAVENELPDLEKFAAVVAPYLSNVQKIQQYFEPPVREEALLAKYAGIGLLGRSRKFVELLQAVEAASRCEVRVLLEGQSGTGKEMIARAIHNFSSRSKLPFVAIDCGAIPTNLVESELFGHVKGAFTGAATDRKGLIAEADNGTLFMDEIANLPIDVQAKLMRVLQEGEVRPVGSNKTHKVDVRVIAASSGSLRKLVAANTFREDLFYRLHVYPVLVPSLQERAEDIPLLANHFLTNIARQQGKQAQAFHAEIMDFMQQRPWPGNIRELENFVERLVTLSPPESPTLSRDILPKDLVRELKKFGVAAQDDHVTKSLNESLAEHEERIIRQTLANNNWNQAQTARQLKISDETLRYKMKKLGIVKRET